MSLAPPPDAPFPPPVPVRRDALPPWVSALLVVFLVLRIVEVASESRRPAVAARAAKRMDTDSMQDLIAADLQAKTAYVVTLPKPVVRPETRALRLALKSAEDLEAETDNTPAAARRVIILRAVLDAAEKDGPEPLAANKGLDPLAAFTTALPAGTPPVDRALYAQEAQVWKTAFGKDSLTPHQLDALASQMRALPNLRWWQWPALSGLYGRQGDLAEANRYALVARARAVSPLVGSGLVGMVRFALGLAGVLLLLYFVLKAAGAFRAGPNEMGLNLWPTLPERQPFSLRRLGAGDLMAVFVVYLVAREVFGVLLAGFPGLGRGHWLHVSGLLTPFLPALKRLPALRRNEWEDVLATVHYLLSALPPVLYLRFLARRRGASLADELGWSRRALGPNLGYGLAGYALATPLFLLAALLAPRLFRHAPTPSNPIIPQIAGTSDFWAVALLIVLTSVAAPLVEELLFRGVLYNAAKLRLGVWPAILLTGVVFGGVHPVGLAEMVPLAVLGGVFAWMAETRKSLVPSIAAHFLNNFTTTLMLLFVLSG